MIADRQAKLNIYPPYSANMNTTVTNTESTSHPIVISAGSTNTVPKSADPIMALGEWRLQYWLSADCASGSSCLEKLQAQKGIDVLFSAPPIIRTTMPTASLEPPRLGRLLRSTLEKLIPARAFRLRHRTSVGS